MNVVVLVAALVVVVMAAVVVFVMFVIVTLGDDVDGYHDRYVDDYNGAYAWCWC